MGLVVRDERRRRVRGRSRRSGTAVACRIGVPLDTSQIAVSLKRYFGGADVTFVTFESSVPFFEGHVPDLDALPDARRERLRR